MINSLSSIPARLPQPEILKLVISRASIDIMSIMDEQAVDEALARQLQDDAYAQAVSEDILKDESENELDDEGDDDLEDYHGKILREYRLEDDIEDAAEDETRGLKQVFQILIPR